MQKSRLFCPSLLGVAGEGAFGGETQLEGLPHPDWLRRDLLCSSAALSRRFSSSTKGYISPKLDASHYFFFIELLSPIPTTQTTSSF